MKHGRGFIRIRKAISDYPTMKFDYKEIQGGYLVEFSYDEQKKDEDAHYELENELENKLSIKEKGILKLMSENPKISQRELSEKIGIKPQGPKTQFV